jgi:hypothetical protein
MPCGLWIGTTEAEYVYCEQGTTPFRVSFIALHEIAHRLLGHRRLPARQGLARLLAGPAARQRLSIALALTACAVLTAVALRPGLPGILAILLVSGLCDSYQVQANASFAAAVPDSLRGQAFGLALGGMYLGQGAVMTDDRAAAEHADALPVIAVAGAAGAAAAVLVSVSGRTGLHPNYVPHRGPPISPSAVGRVGLSVGAAGGERG